MLVIIQARSGSKRFKNKVLYPIYNIPLISHVFHKINKTKKKIKIIVSTSNSKSDNKLVNYLKINNINYFRGSLKNVALRLYKTAKKHRFNYFARISGDSPLFDFRILEKALSIKKKYKKIDLITNVYPRTFPKGQSIEIIKTSIIHDNLSKFNSYEKEHVTTYFYKNSKNFKIKNFTSTYKFNSLKLSIDTIEDLDRIKKKINKKKFINFKLK